MFAERNMKWAQGHFPGKELAVCRTLGQLGPWSSLLGTLPLHSYYSQNMGLTSQEPNPGTAFSKENEFYLSHGLLVLVVSSHRNADQYSVEDLRRIPTLQIFSVHSLYTPLLW